MAIGKHIVEHAILGVDSTTTLDARYVNISGDTMTGALGIGPGTPRVGAQFDITGTGNGTIGNVSGATITINYNSVYGTDYYNDGYSFQYDIYGYRDYGGTIVYSTLSASVSASDNANGDGTPYSVDLTWNSLQGVDGYRVVVTSDTYWGASGNYYFDITNTSVHINGGVIIETGGSYVGPGTPAVTPKTATTSADWYVSKYGDTFSTGHFYFGNLPTLTLGNNNGLFLTGVSDYTLSLPTTARVNLGGLSLKAGRAPTGNHLVFPQGYGGSTSPGIRFEGGQTDGGLAMDDGILEFWNNFSRYVTPVSGRLQAVFRIDTRSGYESEGFIVGGSLTSGTGFVSLGMNFGTGDVNMCYYGYGSVSVGTDVGTAGISGNGHLGVKYDFYAGRNIIVNSTSGMKIGTATTQKLGFFNATPIVQVANTTDLGTVLSNLGLRAAGTAYPITTSGAVNFTGGLTIATTGMTITDVNIALSATTGTKIGTATTQKLAFYNSTPVVKATALTTKLTQITHTAPGTPDYAIQDLTQTTPYGFVTKDEGNSVLKVILNLQTRVDELETKLQAYGLLA